MLVPLIASIAMGQSGMNSVLVFSKTAGYRHDSIESGVTAIKELGAANKFAVDHTEDSAAFNAENLEKYRVVIFLNTTGDILDDTQQEALVGFMKKGRGFVGIHAAADTEYEWPWYGQLVGAWFASHPRIQQATVDVVDRKHPSTSHLDEKWVRTDEWYDYKAQPVAGTRVLCKLDTTTYEGHKMGENHPIAWCRDFESGRTFYTGGGHTKESYSDPDFRKHLLGGILWAMRRV